MKTNMVGWFEIPVEDMERAIKFYETILETKLERNKMESVDMAWFPYDTEKYGSGGTLIQHEEFYKPSSNGVLIYLSAPSGDLSNELARVEKAGGSIIQEKTAISPEHGHYGLMIDSEGNRIALHSEN